MKIFHLNNPAAGNGSGNNFFPLINREIDKYGIECEAVQTKYEGNGTALIKDLDFQNYDALVVSGGDGTLFEALNGYFNNKSGRKIPIAVVPIGRGNAFARDINLTPANWKDSIKIISEGKIKKVDVAKFIMQGAEYYFINILGLGFVTDVAKTAFKLRSFGHLSYLIGVFYRTIKLRPYELKIEIDGNIIERENVFAEISNSRYTGKDFLMAPSAKIDDGFLDVILLNKVTRARLLQCLPKIFNGTHIKMKEVETFKAKKIKIATNPTKLLTPDGQLMGSTPIEIECLPKAIEVFAH
jgi:YegS/Rv2252/BmrU family lipid kinase